VAIGAGAACVSLVVCLVVSSVGGRIGARLDPDAYGALAHRIWQGDGFAFEPHAPPTLHRGPAYPAFVAAALAVSNGWFPGSLWVAQSLLHGVTAGIACYLASKLWGRAAGVVAGVGCAVGPALLWYVPRIWSETLLAFLCLSLFALLVGSQSGWTTSRSLCLGAIVGTLSLTKGVFLPLILLTPLLVWLTHRRVGFRRVLPTPLVAVLIVLPWTIRNYAVSGAFVPVEVGVFFNVRAGNILAQRIAEHPLSYGDIWQDYVIPVALEVRHSVPRGPEGELREERIHREAVFREIASNPALLVKKPLVAGSTFWILGDSPVKSLLNIIARLPILAFAVVGLYRRWRQGLAAKTATVLIAYYWGCHLLFAPAARHSTPLIPILTVFAAAGLLAVVSRWRHRFPGRARETAVGPPLPA
jgi:hypothetical protein